MSSELLCGVLVTGQGGQRRSMKRRNHIVTSLAVVLLMFGAALHVADGRSSNAAQEDRRAFLPQVVLGNYQGGNTPESFSFRRERAAIEFRKVRGPEEGGAVLGLGKPGAFDAVWATCPSVLFDGRIYRMWYSSFYDSHMGVGGIGMATSTDGIHWKRANNGQPVLSVGPQGAFDDGQIMGPDVDFDEHLYRMWYTGMASKWGPSGLGYYRIGLATSADGIHWTRAHGGRPVFDLGPPGSFDSVQVATPSVLRVNGKYRMWYAAWSPKTQHRICVADSRDGIHWRRENRGKPVSGLRAPYAYGPAVCRIDGQFLLLYTSSPTLPRGLYAAASSDGFHWRIANGGKPVLPPGSSTDIDGSLTGHACLLKIGHSLKVWYTGYRRERAGIDGWKLRIGLAEMSIGKAGRLDY